MNLSIAPLAAIAAIMLTPATVALAETRTYSDLAAFSKVSASAGLTVEVTPAESHSVTAEAGNADAFDHLEISVEGGTLIITRDSNLLDFIFDGGLVGALFGGDRDVTVFVATPEVQQATATSGADLNVNGFGPGNLAGNATSGADLNITSVGGGTLELSASSGANINASGICSTLDANVSSGADIDAGELVCEAGNLTASSGADLTAHVTGGVNVQVSSGANVTIYGDPQSTDLSQSSGGSISLRD